MNYLFLALVLSAIVTITNIQYRDRSSIFLTDAGLTIMLISVLLIIQGVLNL